MEDNIEEISKYYKGNKIICLKINSQIWYKGLDIAIILGYKNTEQAIRVNVNFNYKKKACDLLKENKLLESRKKLSHNTMFINKKGINQLLIASKKPGSIDLSNFFGMNVLDKLPYKETEVVNQLAKFFDEAKIVYIYQKQIIKDSCSKYFTDLYLPDYKLAIEIDEMGHKNRNFFYEENRQTYIENKLNCKFLRFNPDEKNFCIFRVIGKIHEAIQKYHLNIKSI